MLKITGGEFRGRRFKAPPGRGTRPSGAKMRQALFNILGPKVAEARVADLFAGSGALGLEALSRGAAACIFVESSRPVAKLLLANLESLGLSARGRVITAPLEAAEARLLTAGPFDLVLADPPYGKGLVEPTVALAGREGILRHKGILALEHSPAERPEATETMTVADRRRYGRTELTLMTASK